MGPQWTRRRVLRRGVTLGAVGVAGCLEGAGTGPTSTTRDAGDEATVDASDATRTGEATTAYRGDTFDGVLTVGAGSTQPASVPAGVYQGTVVYDRSCSPVGGGLTGCDAGIATQTLGTVNVYYEHDMGRKPCLVPDQAVLLTVEGSEVVVQRRR